MLRKNVSAKLQIAAERNIKERDFWLNKLSGNLEKTVFPYDYKKAGADEFKIDSTEFQLAEEEAGDGVIFSRLVELSKGSDYTLNLLLITGVILLLNKYSDSKDVLVGTPIYRQDTGGEFLNTVLVLRNTIKNSMTVKEFLRQVRQTITEAVENQNYPIEILVEKLNPGDLEEGFPFFDVTVLMENIHEKEYLEDIRNSMSFTFGKKDGFIKGHLEYNSFLYEKSTVEKIVAHFKILLQQFLFNVDLPLSGINILTGDEQKQLLYDFNDTQAGFPVGKTIHRLFEEQVEKTPNNIAVCSPIDLNDIYDQLQSQTVNPGLAKKMETFCFKKNSYVYQSPLSLPDENKNTHLKILKTHRHNSVIVNHHVAQLMDIFDGRRNLQVLHYWLKDLIKVKAIPVEFLIYSMRRSDLLEISFEFDNTPGVFSIDRITNRFEDFVQLVKTLYRHHLIELVGVEKKTSILKNPITNYFSRDEALKLKDTILLENLLIKDKEISTAPVLLLGDTPGTSTTGLLYLGSYLKRNGIEAYCQFYDPAGDNSSMKVNTEELLRKIQPVIVAISLKWFLYISRVLDMCKIVKEYAREHSLDIKVVVGGNTASYYWQEIIKYDFIDVLVRGDGEEPILRICHGEDLVNIPNCIYKKSGKIMENPITYVQDKTNSSGIYLSHLDEILLSNHASLFSTFFIYTHKGCAMNCLYCGGCNQAQQKAFNRKTLFRRGIEEVRKDIIEAKKYASTFQFEFDILDENLPDYCQKIWEGIELSGHFCIFSTLKPPTENLIRLVSHTFKYVYWDYDICTLSERHREQLFSLGLVKPQSSDKEILNFMAQCEKYQNIEVRLNLITGLPYFTLEDIEPGEQLLSKIMNTYSCFGELHWARLHAQPGAPILENPGKHSMHSYASTFEDFFKYSEENFNRESTYATVENFNYPYIYFNDDQLNSRITNFYLETNKKIAQHTRDKKRGLIVSNTLTYRQLNEKAEQLAGVLRAKGIKPGGGSVGLMLERSIEIPVGILGILKARCGYMPIDPEFPTGRIEYMLKDSKADVLVTTRDLIEENGKIRSWAVEKILLEDISASSVPSVAKKNHLHLSPWINAPATSLAYVIYTSGTTGKPKGVLLTHENLVNYVHWFTAAADLKENDKTLLTSSFAFDLGYTSLYTSLLNGGELHILPREIYLLGERLLDYIGQKGITYIKVTPSLFSVIVHSPNFSAKAFKILRVAAIGGEAINVKDIEKAHALCPHIRIMNHYGPTEATIGCVAAFIDFNDFETYKGHPVIGKPINNSSVYILGKDLNVLPVGVPGELCISGTCLARGYLNQPELTAEKFKRSVISIPSKLSANDRSHSSHSILPSSQYPITPLPHFPIYRTGDLSRWLPDGTIEFLGRIDNQVKIRGYRVELGEIENRLQAYPHVEEAVVLVKEAREKDNAPGNGDKYLCAYIVPKGGKAAFTAEAGNEKKTLTSKDMLNAGCQIGGQAQSILSVFQKQVKKNGNKVAVKSDGRLLTYNSLDRFANWVARKISEKYDDRYKLSPDERTRYKRQMLLHGWGGASQEKLKSTTVFVAGAGGGASPTIMQLALIGIGTIKVCDFDEVELSNLNRQFLHQEERLGMNKALSAQITISKVNPNVNVIPYTQKLTRENVSEMVGDAEIIFDMFDGPADKFILSQYAVARGIPHVVISMTDINAYTAVFHPPKTPCYHCIFDKKKLETIVSGMQNQVENYSKNPLPVVATSLFISTGTAVNEALKILLGFERPAYNKFLYFNQRGEGGEFTDTPGYKAMTHLFSDHFLQLCKEQGFDWDIGWRGNFLEELNITPGPDCPICGAKGKEKRKTLEGQVRKTNEKAASVPIEVRTAEDIKMKENKKEKRETVALLLGPDIEMAVGITGVLKSGKTFVPLDPLSPMAALCDILVDSESRIILVDHPHMELAQKLIEKTNRNIKIINVEGLCEPGTFDENSRLENFDIEIGTVHSAYILYSPHSTGTTDFNASVKELYDALFEGDTPYIFGIKDKKQETGPLALTGKLRDYLLEELPHYMIPTHYVQLEQIPLTLNGKVDLKALPDPGVEGKEEKAFISPRDEVERKLAAIWAEVLEVEKDIIGVDSNFFELGGHSLKATIMVSRVHKELNVKLPLAEIFKTPRIGDISGYIKSVTKDKHISIEPLEERDYYALSSAQKRLYVLQHMDLESISYNMPIIIPLAGHVDNEKMEEAFKALIRRHENLRTSFEMINSRSVQRVHREVNFKIDYYTAGSSEEKSPYSSRERALNNFVRPFNLAQPPLLRVGVLKGKPGGQQLMVDVHHIISDGTSNAILKRDFLKLYAGDELEPLRLQYKDFSNWQNALFESGKIKQQEDYWLDLYSGEIPKLNLLADYPRPTTFNFKGDTCEFILAAEETIPFKELSKQNNATLFMNILTAFNLLLHKYTGQDDIIVGTGAAGRSHTDLQGVIGMFVNMLALRNYPGGDKTYDEFLKEVRDNSLKAFENQEVQFEELVEKLSLERDPSRNPLFDVAMVVQNFEQESNEVGDISIVASSGNQSDGILFAPYEQKEKTSKFDMAFFLYERSNEVHFVLEYYTGIFRRETIERLVSHFMNIIRQVIKGPGTRISEIDFVSEEEKQELLVDFNNTGIHFPVEQTIHELFEEQVRKTPDTIASVFEDKSLSYRLLDEKANQLAHYLRFGAQVQPESLIGILMTRSLEQIIAILGVLKAGGAYLPIDFSLPEARIKNMIDDAGVEIVLSSKRLIGILNKLQWECKTFNTFLCMDSPNVYREEEIEKSRLMDEKLWDYVADSATDEITGGGWFTSYTGEPFSVEEMEEYGENIFKKLTPLLHEKMKVLEIGCGSGISMYRIAPKVDIYYATDLSGGIIENNRKRVLGEGHTNIFLSQLAAHEIDRIDQQHFDLVIINSVIQSFHGHNYLREVIRKAIDLLSDNGYLFIGDVLDQELKEELIREMIEFRYGNSRGNSKTKTDWSADLFVSRTFFEDLSIDLPAISRVEFSEKIHTIENELTKFRYDTLITIDKIYNTSKRIKSKNKYQLDIKVLENFSSNKAKISVKPGNLAYVIYTSGSTGKPKGVMVKHRNVIRLVKNPNYIDFSKNDRLLLTGNIIFDITTFEIWGPLLNGITLFLVEQSIILEVEQLKDALSKNKITILHLVPQLFNQLASAPGGLEIFSALDYFLVGGDLVSPGYINELERKFKQLKIIHMYGPTENTTFSTFYLVDKAFEYKIPIGKPIGNSYAYVVETYSNNLQPLGIAGELLVGGGVARGYLNQPHLTAEKFIENPHIPGKRLYKTGDLARWLTDGNIEFLGRSDSQVKIRGIRIEVEEIEKVFLEHPEVEDCVVVSRDIKEDKQLAAYYKTKNKIQLWPSLAEYFVYDDLLYTAMTQDEARNEKYRNAIHKVITGKIVLEIGPGSEAILSRMCIEEGAVKVYAVEILEDAYQKAKEKVKSLGLEDRIILIHGDIGEVELPEPVDYCVSEVVGSIGGSEGAAKIINSARLFLKKPSHMIPARSLTKIAAITLPKTEFDGSFEEIGAHYVEKVFKHLGYKFDLRLCLFSFSAKNVISTSDVFEDLDFTRKNVLEEEHEIYLKIQHSSILNGFILWLNLYVDDEVLIESLENKYIWLPIYLPVFSEGEPVKEGDYIQATVVRKLSKNGINPDFTISGQLHKSDSITINFIYHIPHVNTEFKGDPFYKEVFSNDALKVKGKVTSKDLREFLSSKLPDYMVPTYIMEIEKMPLTPSGKLDRKKLPVPEVAPGDEYSPPGNELEETLTQIWSEVLKVGKEKIGIDANFFDLGGHSLKATTLAARIHKELSMKIPLTEIFKNQTIRGLSGYIRGRVVDKHVVIDSAEKKEFYPLSSAQKRLYYLQQMDLTATAYNMPHILTFEKEMDREKLETTFKKLIARHESLRTAFEIVEEEPVQRIHEDVDLKIGYYEPDRGSGAEPQQSSGKMLNHFIKPFDLSRAPLVRVVLITPGDGTQVMIIDIHHIITDGTSQTILTTEFEAINAGEDLPPLRLHYKDYSQWQQRQAMEEVFKPQEEFWLKELEGAPPPLNLPLDYPRPAVQDFEGREIGFKLSKEETKNLNELARREDTTLFMVLFAGINVFLSKVSSQEDIVVGSPIAGRGHADLEKVIGMFINTLVLRNYPSGKKKFENFFKEVKVKALEAFENQDYQFENLVEKVVPQMDMSRNPVFDVMFALQNIHEIPGNIGEEEKETTGGGPRPYAYETRTSIFDLMVTAVEVGETLHFTFQYCTKLFREETIVRFIQYFKKIISSVVESPGKKIAEIELISEEEKTRILIDFNNTDADYPKASTIHQFFEQQEAKTPDRIAIVGESAGTGLNAVSTQNMQHISYKELNKKADRLALLLRGKGVKPESIVAIMVDRSIEMIVGILAILKAGGAYLPIVNDYPPDRITFMLEDSDAALVLTQAAFSGIIYDKCEVIDLNAPHLYGDENNGLNKTGSKSSDLAYVIYTSGSTGKPKGVMIEHISSVNILFALHKEYPFRKPDTYLLKTSFAFDVSITELFGWFLGGGRLAILEKNGEKDPYKILDAIESAGITHINFVPSMFNAFVGVLNPQNIGKLTSLKYIFLAGEALLAEPVDKFRKLNSKIVMENIYGPTEASVYSSNYSLSHWGGGESVPIGKPMQNVKVYILDRYNNLQPIGLSGELCISGEGVARGYLKRPELTAEKFLPDPFMPGSRMYRTGDLCRWFPDGNIEFLGRMDYQVKIRGFRIEPGEVENQLLNHDDIEEAVVVERREKNGDNYLAAYIVSGKEFTVSHLREYLSMKIPHYMIPSYFIHVAEIPLTTNGKIDRKVLPQPEIKAGEEHVAPRNRLEEKLVEIWAVVLAIKKERIGIDANFFELGGHSLKSTILTIRIHKELNVKISLAEVFKNSTIRKLANIIKKLVVEKYISIEPAEEKEYYTLSSAQRRLYILQQMETELTSYNMPHVLPLGEDVDKENLEKAFRTLIDRHESLRTSYRVVHEEPVQKVHENVEFKIEYYEGDRGEGIAQDFVRPFDLAHAPILRVRLVNVESSHHCLLLDMHHIITDGISQGILTNEFMALYAGEKLPPLRLRYIDYSEWQNSDKQKEAVKQQENYWIKQYEGDIPVLNMYIDYPRPTMQSFEGSIVDFELNREETKGLNEIAQADGATLFMVLLALFNIFLSKLSRQEDIVVGTPVSGRNHDDLVQIIGMFVNTLPLRNFPSGEKEFAAFLMEVKERTLEAFENQDYPFEDLVEKVNVEKDMSRNPLFDVMFAFQDLRDASVPIIEENVGNMTDESHGYKHRTSKFDLSLSVIHKGEKLSCVFEYCTKLFKEGSIVKFKKYFKQIISSVLETPGKKVSGIEIISEEEKKQVLIDFNNTESDYPKDITIHRLFEEQEAKIPHYIAIIGNNYSLSYRDLNKKASQLTHVLRARGVMSNSVVGIMVERSIEMIVGILAILKAGAAYLPIVPDYPPGRISFMLEDSDAKAVLTQKSFLNIAKDNFEVIDLEDPQLYEEKNKNLNNTMNITDSSSAKDLAYLIYTSGSTGKPKGVLVEHRSSVNTLFALQEKYPFGESDNYLLKTSFVFDVSTAELFGWFLGGGRLFILEKNGEKDPYKILDTIENADITHINFVPSMFRVLADILNPANIKKLTGLKYIFLAGEALLPELVNKFRKLNTKIPVENIYGPTEAAVYASSYSLSQWEGKGSIPIGKPMSNVRLYILNKENRLQPVGVPGELCISGEGVAKGYLNRPELTTEKFRSDPFIPDGRMYRTGDLARWLLDGNIAFLGRIDVQVKLRGFRIEPGEIENQLIDHGDIKEAVVIEIRENGEDNNLAAYIVSEKAVNVARIKEYLSIKLPYYMVPTYYMQVDEIPLTPNGKIDRKALPKPQVKTGESYVAPGNEVEKKLAEIWSEVLRVKKDLIGIDSNFFELTGHSLKATVMAAKVHKELNVKIPLSEVFKTPTIRRLSERIKGLTVDKYASIEPVEKKEYYALSSAQKRLYIEQQLDFNSTRYNFTQYFSVEGKLKKENLIEAFRRLIQRHESLRTSFDTIDGEPVQRIHKEVGFEIEYLNILQAKGGKWTESKIELGPILQNFKRPFELSKAPLLRVGLIKVETKNHLFMVDMHHIITDDISNGILVQDFLMLYSGQQLSHLTLQYKDYSEWQNNGIQEKSIKQQENYWLKQFEGELPVLKLPSDYDRPAVKRFEGDFIKFQIDRDLTARLNRLALETNTTLFVVLLVVYSILLARYSGQEDIVVGTTITGRPHVDLQNIIGMFVNMMPMRTFPKSTSIFKEFLEDVKEMTLNAFANQDYQFDELIAKLDLERDPGRNPMFEVVLDLHNADLPIEERSEIENLGLNIMPYQVSTGKALFDLVLGVREIGDTLVFELSYPTSLYKRDTVITMSKHFKRIIKEIVKNPGLKISKIEVLSNDERKNLLKDTGSKKKRPIGNNQDTGKMAVKFNF